MRIVWDEVKRQRNLQEHGLDFADIETHFEFATAITSPTYAGRGGRARFKSIGRLRSRMVILVFSLLGTEAISLISVRPAGRRERRLYEQG